MKKEAKAATAAPKQSRQYKDDITFDHDLYRLDNTELIRNIAWSKKQKPMYEPFDHKHFFHTFDSDGRKQTRCVAALGHFHEMTVVDNGPDSPPTVTCGPAMREVLMRDSDDGVYKKMAVQLEGREAHKHTVSYVASERLRTRKSNAQAAKMLANVTAHQTPALSAEERSTIKETGREKVID